MRIQINQQAREKEDLERIEREKDTYIKREKQKQKDDQWYSSYYLTRGRVEQGTGTLAMVCLDCGTEMYGVWEFPCFSAKTGGFNPFRALNTFKAVDEEIESFKRMKKCPFCGGKVWPYASRNIYDRYKRGEPTVSWGYGDNLKIQYSVLSDNLKLYDTDKVSTKIDKISNKKDQPVAVKISSSINEIKGSPEQLQEYILQLIHLEANIYALTERLRALYYTQIQTQRKVVYEDSQPTPLDEKKEKIENELSATKDNLALAEEDLHKAEEALSLAKAELLKVETHPIQIDYPKRPEEPQYEKAGFFNKKRVLAENAEKQKLYEQALNEYERKMSECEQLKIDNSPETKRAIVAKAEDNVSKAKSRLSIVTEELQKAQKDYEEICTEIEKKNAEKHLILTPVRVMNNSIVKEIKEAEKLLGKTYSARNELYAYNIVFAKYRDIIALTTFYEYLMSGRCTSLEGANGAYNIYENEIRLNMIISQLSTVIEKLEEIKQAQYMLYSEMKTANENLSKLNEKMDKAVSSLEKIQSNTENIMENTALIAYNTEVTAYYTKKNSELLDALGYMVAFK